MRCPRDLAVGCNCRVWSGIRRLTALAALPKRVLGGREFPSVETLCTAFPWRERALTSFTGGYCPTMECPLVNGHYWLGPLSRAYGKSEQIEWPRAIESEDGDSA